LHFSVMIVSPGLDIPDDAACRVCHCGSAPSGDDGPLVCPCLCDGSVRWVHRTCLKQWRLQGARGESGALRCELCGFTYLYELRRKSRRGKLSTRLQFDCSIVALAFLMAAVVSCFSSPSVGLLVVPSVLTLWAVVDMLPLRALGQRVLIKAVRQLALICKLSAQEADAQAKTMAQAKAAAQAAKATHTLSKIQARLRRMEPALLGEQVAGPAFEVTGVDNADLESRIGNFRQAEGAGLTGTGREFLASSHPFYIRNLRGKHIAGCAILAPFLFAAAYFAGPPRLNRFDRQLASNLGLVFVSSGTAYWFAVAVVRLAVVMCGPPDYEPIRGKDGFYVLRNLQMQERDAWRS